MELEEVAKSRVALRPEVRSGSLRDLVEKLQAAPLAMKREAIDVVL